MVECDAYILVGGQATRLGGVVKPLIAIDGRPIIERQLEVLGSLFSRIVLVGGDPMTFAHLGVRHVDDQWPGTGPLGGVATAMATSEAKHVFVFAGDMPYLSGVIIERMLAVIAEDPSIDVLVPERAGLLEPLHAAYSRRMLSSVRAKLQANALSVRGIADPDSPLAAAAKRIVIQAEDQMDVDPELRFLHNVNRTSDLD